jgi:hypothetical protein
MRYGCQPGPQKLPVFRSIMRRAGALLYSLIEMQTERVNESYLRYVLDVIADWPINRVSELLLARSTAN